MKRIELSLLALQNEKNIEEKLEYFWKKGIKNIHYDVMDGKFVPNIAFEGEYIDLIRKIGFEISVHLMVEDVSSYVNKFIKYDIQFLTFHIEGIDENTIIEALKMIKSKNIVAGVAIKPSTKIKELEKISRYIDIITIMSVEPGKGGQLFIEETYKKLEELKNNKILCKKIIQIDGGINDINIIQVSKYVNLIVSGSFLAKANNIKEIISSIKE